MNQIVPWVDIVHQIEPQFQKIAREHNLVKWQVESSFAVQTINKNPRLQECNIESVQNAVVNVAAVGLTLNPADGYAYLVPEYSKALRGQECQLRISFKGLVKIATDTGAINYVKAEIVKENDTFTYNGPCDKPTHSMDPFKERGNTVGVYCIAKTKNDEYLTDIMNIEDITKIQNCAKTKNVWENWFDEMAKKAIIKRASKQWPKTEASSVLHKAVEVINETEGGYDDPFLALEKTAADILELMKLEDFMGIGEIWCELDEKEKKILWTAKTKGGWFSMKEKELLKTGSLFYKRQCWFDEHGSLEEWKGSLEGWTN